VIFLQAGAANLPDLDVFLPWLFRWLSVDPELFSDQNHHCWPTHTPLFWLLTSQLTYKLLSRQQKFPAAKDAAPMMLLGASVHLIQDALADQIPFLWPLSQKRFGAKLGHSKEIDRIKEERESPPTIRGRIKEVRDNWFKPYKKTRAFHIERVLITGAYGVVLGRLLKEFVANSREGR
jgi:hypothetical protein